MKDKVKIQDIARKSGVSASTVSLVLNNKPGVAQKTRSRVFQMAQELKYPGKSETAFLRNELLNTIGMVVKIDPDTPPQANPFYSKVIVGIEDACRRKGIKLLFATLPVDENNCPTEIPQLLYNDSLDGLLLVGTFVDENVLSISGSTPPPIVLVDGYSVSGQYDTVISDNFQAAYRAVSHLIDNGHRHIGLMGGDIFCYPSLKERRAGYQRALKDHQIPDSYLCDFNINRSKGYYQALEIIKKNPQITALFCVNDDIGSAAMRAAHALGRVVPDDFSIISYDDTYIATNTQPTLSTMHVDTIAMGRAAVHLLALRLEYPESERMTLTIHPTLVERESTGPAPASRDLINKPYF